MKDEDSDIDNAVAAYAAELQAEAELGLQYSSRDRGHQSAGTLALAMVEILGLQFRASGLLFELGSYAMIASGALAAAASAVVSWRTAGSRFGSLRALNS